MFGRIVKSFLISYHVLLFIYLFIFLLVSIKLQKNFRRPQGDIVNLFDNIVANTNEFETNIKLSKVKFDNILYSNIECRNFLKSSGNLIHSVSLDEHRCMCCRILHTNKWKLCRTSCSTTVVVLYVQNQIFNTRIVHCILLILSVLNIYISTPKNRCEKNNRIVPRSVSLQICNWYFTKHNIILFNFSNRKFYQNDTTI